MKQKEKHQLTCRTNYYY